MANAWESAPVVGESASSSSKAAWANAPIVDKSGDKGDKRIHLGEAQDSEHMSTPEYMIDQADRAPFKLLDTAMSLTPGGIVDTLRSHLPEAWGGKPAPQGLGDKAATALLGKEPEAAGVGQAVAGAGASAAATGPAGGEGAIAKIIGMAKSGAFGATQEGAVQGMMKLGLPREYADKIALALGIGTSVGAAKLAGGKSAAEAKAVEKTKDYVANREAVNDTASPNASPAATQDALSADLKVKQAALSARDTAADSIQKAADKHIEDTVQAFQPGSTFGQIAQESLSKVDDSVRTQVKAQAQGTLQKVTETPRVDASQALALAQKYEKDFKGRNTVSGSVGGVADNILSNTKENLGKTSAPVGSGKISSTLTNKLTTDSATLDGKTAHNIIGDINDRIEGKGKYAAEGTPDVSNLLAVKKALIASIDKSSGGAYTKYLNDYASGMAKLDPFQRGQTAETVTNMLDYGRMNKLGAGEAAEALFAKGAKGGTTAERIQSLMKDDPNFQSSLKSFVGQKLSDLKASPGGLTPQKIAAFQRDYGPAMKAYGINVGSVQDAVQAAAAREAELTSMRKATQTQRDQYASSALAKAAGVADSSMVLDPIMQGDRSARLANMRQAVQAIQKSPQAAAAMDGMRSKFNQYFFDHPEQSEDLALMAQKSGLYTPEQAANIRKVADQIRGENAQTQAKRMVKGGLPDLDNKAGVASYVVHKVGFILMSGGIGTVAGGPVGGIATGAAALAGQSLIARQKQMTVDAIAKIIEDPKMAKVMAEKPNKANAELADRIARQIAADVVRQNSSNQDQQAGQ
jgi:hypothetical protein